MSPQCHYISKNLQRKMYLHLYPVDFKAVQYLKISLKY